MKFVHCLFTISLVVSGCAIRAKNNCTEKNFTELQKLIHRNISTDVDQYESPMKSEYFIIDVKLNEDLESVHNVDFFRKDQSVHHKQLSKAVDKLKADWKPFKCEYNRYLIPVFLLLSSDEDVQDYPSEEKTRRFETSKGKTFVLQPIVIPIYPRIR